MYLDKPPKKTLGKYMIFRPPKRGFENPKNGKKPDFQGSPGILEKHRFSGPPKYRFWSRIVRIQKNPIFGVSAKSRFMDPPKSWIFMSSINAQKRPFLKSQYSRSKNGVLSEIRDFNRETGFSKKHDFWGIQKKWYFGPKSGYPDFPIQTHRSRSMIRY